MRRFLIPLMAATMLAPAVVHAQDGAIERAMRNHGERSSSRDNDSDNRASRSESRRSERSNSDRPARAERTRGGENPAGADRVRRIDREDRGVPRVERVQRADREVQQVNPVQVTRPAQPVQRTERQSDGLVDAFRRAGRDTADGRTGDRDDDRDWRRDRDGRGDNDRDWRRDRDGRHGWSGSWRRDRRYDWHNYRNRYGSLYRLGRYYDPYGYGYRRFSIGFNLWPSYYGSSFWLSDPWQYRLPPAYGPYRWIRYYNDALLVDIYTGQVVDVEHNVFW